MQTMATLVCATAPILLAVGCDSGTELSLDEAASANALSEGSDANDARDHGQRLGHRPPHDPFGCGTEEMRQRLLEEFDGNGDGNLDNDEQAPMAEEFGAEDFPRADGLPPPPPPPPWMKGLMSPPRRAPGKHQGADRGPGHGPRAAALRHLRWTYDADESHSIQEAEVDLLREDLEARCETILARLLENFDADGDGEVSDSERQTARQERREQHQARRAAFIVEHDSDGDGRLDGLERDAAHDALRERHEARRADVLDEFDADDSGDLDFDERTALRAKMRQVVRAEIPPPHGGPQSDDEQP